MKWQEALNNHARTQGNYLYVEKDIEKGDFDLIKRALAVFRAQWVGGKKQRFELAVPADEALDYLLACSQMPNANPHSFHPTPLEVKSDVFTFTRASTEYWTYLDRPVEILEPHGGEGSFCDSVREAFDAAGIEYNLTIVELDPINCMTLKSKGYNPINADFLEFEPDKSFDLVITNPPFEGLNFIKHIRRAQSFLSQNGALVGIVPSQPFKKRRDSSAVKALVNDAALTLEDSFIFKAGVFETAKKTETRIIELLHPSKMETIPNEELKSYFCKVTQITYESESEIIREINNLDLLQPRNALFREVNKILGPIFEHHFECNVYCPDEWRIDFIDMFVDELLVESKLNDLVNVSDTAKFSEPVNSYVEQIQPGEKKAELADAPAEVTLQNPEPYKFAYSF